MTWRLARLPLLLPLLVTAWCTGSVEARLFPLGSKFHVNVHTAGDQLRPAVVAIPDGGFVVVWEDRSRGAVFGRRFDSNGVGIGAEFELEGVVPRFGLETQRGELVVAWGDIVGWFGLDGAVLDRLVVPGADVREGRSVAVTASGEIGLVWREDTLETPIRGQRIDAEGRIAGPSFVVAADEVGNQYPHLPRITHGPEDSFVVVWWAEASSALWGQRIDAEDRPLGDRFAIVDPDQLGDLFSLDICGDRASGEFVVAWNDYGRAFQFRRFGLNAEPLTSRKCAGLEGVGSMTCLSGDRIAVSSSGGVMARFFDDNDRLIGNIRVSLSSPAPREFNSNATVAALGDDTTVVVWTDCADAEAGCDIFGQQFALTAGEECAGDCNGDGRVSVDELITAVNVALQRWSDPAGPPWNAARCGPVDANLDCFVSIDEILAAVDRALEGCE